MQIALPTHIAHSNLTLDHRQDSLLVSHLMPWASAAAKASRIDHAENPCLHVPIDAHNSRASSVAEGMLCFAISLGAIETIVQLFSGDEAVCVRFAQAASALCLLLRAQVASASKRT